MPGRLQDGDLGFPLGMFSADDPDVLPAGAYFRAVNVLSRGRVPGCRPGYDTVFNLPPGNLQGCTMYRPSDGTEHLVFAVDGKVYYSIAPFRTYTQIRGIQFAANSPAVYWCNTTQAVERNEDGSLTLVDPRSVLIMQDGRTAPAFWDGNKSGHIRTGEFKTPLGTVMAWSGDRLWVARGNRLFASDYANPFSFFEGRYIGELGSFVLPGRATAMAEAPSIDNPFLVVCTETTTTIAQSNIRTRELWDQTPSFIKTILPTIGCPAHRSMVAHNGLLWWFSNVGFTRLDVALAINQASSVPALDAGMAISKTYLAEDLSGICAASFENFIMVSVPHADFFNTHTWVRGIYGDRENWNGYWTGTRPVEWVSDVVDGQPRVFFVSADYDGTNRLWEAFRPEKLDNGCPITWGVETRGYSGGNVIPKQYHYSEFYLTDLSGVVDVKGAWAGTRRGRFKKSLSKRVQADRGSISFRTGVKSGIFALNSQSRRIKTEDYRHQKDETLSSCGVERDEEEQIDVGFQLCLHVNGPGSLNMVRVHMEGEHDVFEGRCEPDESGSRATRYDGAAAKGADSEETVPILKADDPRFAASKSVAVEIKGVSAVGTADVLTTVSQKAADKMAECAARMKATKKAEAGAKPYLGGFGVS